MFLAWFSFQAELGSQASNIKDLPETLEFLRIRHSIQFLV